MNLKYDEESLLELGRTHRTFGLITDYGKRVEIYRGPIDDQFIYWLDFYIDTGWLRECSWKTREYLKRNGWKKIITIATAKDGEELFCIAINVKNELELKNVSKKRLKIGLLKAFFWGLTVGLINPASKFFEILGLGVFLNNLSNKKRN